jgi:hypothetical protein
MSLPDNEGIGVVGVPASRLSRRRHLKSQEPPDVHVMDGNIQIRDRASPATVVDTLLPHRCEISAPGHSAHFLTECPSRHLWYLKSRRWYDGTPSPKAGIARVM